jgi:hypothetical protein
MAVWRTVYPAADIGKWINGEMDEEFLNIIEQSRSLGPRSRRYWKAVFLPAISLPVNVFILLLFQFIWIWPLANYLGIETEFPWVSVLVLTSAYYCIKVGELLFGKKVSLLSTVIILSVVSIVAAVPRIFLSYPILQMNQVLGGCMLISGCAGAALNKLRTAVGLDSLVY